MKVNEQPGAARRMEEGAPLRARHAPLWLAGLAVFYVAGLGLRPLVMPDEYRYAEAAREMVASGDWTVPHLDGALYFEKPILGYWVTALSLRLFGEHAAAVRLPFALATLASAAIVFGLVRRFGPGGDWAHAAAVAFLTSVGVASLGTAAVFDPLFAFGLTATLAALFVAMERPAGAARQAWLAASGAACGVAFLTKGFLAFAIPVSVVLPYLLWSRRARDLLRLGWTPLAGAFAVAIPWSVGIALRAPDFWSFFVVHEHLQRFFGGIEAQHPQPFWIYLPVLAVGALPWTPLLVPAWRAGRPDSPLARFCLCWVVGPLALLSASSGKLPSYALPCFAPLFIWLASAAASQSTARWEAHLRWLALAFASLLGIVGLSLLSPIAALLGIGEAAGAAWPQLRIAWAATLLLAGAVAAAGSRLGSAAGRFGTIALSLGIAYTGALLWFPTGFTHKTPQGWLEARVEAIPADAIVVTDRHMVYPACWHLRRDDVRILGGPGELRYGLSRLDAAAPERMLDERALEALLRDPTRRRPVVVLIHGSRDELPRDPQPARLDSSRGATFARYDPAVRETAPGAPPLS